jgi:hypothetical protein
VTQVKITTTLSSHMLFEAGYSRIWWWARSSRRRTGPGWPPASWRSISARPGTDYGDIRKRDLTLAWNYNAPTTFGADVRVAAELLHDQSVLRERRAQHEGGFMFDNGYRTIVTPMNNGGLQQQYRSACPIRSCCRRFHR